jgi:hypothetical protein
MRVLVALLLLLSLSTSASAECAWVLWENRLVDGNKVHASDWSPRQGFEKAEHCINAWKALPPGTHQEFLYRCLPDTVDPRGPKGR